MQAPEPPDEPERLAELRSLEILDTSPDPMWDRLAQMAAIVCDTPIALISLVDGKRQWFKARVGLDVPETHRDHAFCAHAILDEEVMMVKDAKKDDRFRDNPLVLDHPNIRMYAGAPVRGPGGHALGTLCVIDHRPRGLDKEQVGLLRLLAAQAEDLFRMRGAAIELRRSLETHEIRPVDELARQRIERLCTQLGGPPARGR